MTTVTTVTAGAASADALTDQDYRDIYDELRQRASLRKFADAIGSSYSFAWWSKYERHEIQLNREARQELRRAVGIDPLPPTVAEATAAVDPDATVYQVGDHQPDRLLMIGHSGPLTIHINGACEALTADTTPESHVTTVTRPPQRRPRKTIHLPTETWERLSAARAQTELSWADFLAKLLE